MRKTREQTNTHTRREFIVINIYPDITEEEREQRKKRAAEEIYRGISKRIMEEEAAAAKA